MGDHQRSSRQRHPQNEPDEDRDARQRELGDEDHDESSDDAVLDATAQGSDPAGAMRTLRFHKTLNCEQCRKDKKKAR
ncbi:unnamed protein product [Clonostachys rosea]|uniref:Uncharacterized protein n=1 Tax=Bionectria ochroleuca TaxID=29856 RepID=A0ABY6U9W6_BIOOC|nr:unnamed protein product [Clonostachys rosea]